MTEESSTKILHSRYRSLSYSVGTILTTRSSSPDQNPYSATDHSLNVHLTDTKAESNKCKMAFAARPIDLIYHKTGSRTEVRTERIRLTDYSYNEFLKILDRLSDSIRSPEAEPYWYWYCFRKDASAESPAADGSYFRSLNSSTQYYRLKQEAEDRLSKASAVIHISKVRQQCFAYPFADSSPWKLWTCSASTQIELGTSFRSKLFLVVRSCL